MIWILISFLVFPFLVQSIKKIQRKRVNRSNIPGRVSRLIIALSLKLPRRIAAIEVKPCLCLWNASVIEVPTPVFKKANHITKMRTAYLANGKVGLIEYVSQYLVTSASKKKLEQYILTLNV